MNNDNNSFTYNGVTVEFSEAQKAIILADQNLITKLNNQKSDLQNQNDYWSGVVNNAMNQLNTVCNTLSGFGGSNSPRQKCIDSNNASWNNARAQQSTISDQLNTNATQLASAIKKLNDDTTTIQNDIKLQIQTQQANAAAATSAAANQATVTTAPANAAAANQQALASLQNQAQAAQLKQEQNIKIGGFIVAAIVIIVLAVLVIKRVS